MSQVLEMLESELNGNRIEEIAAHLGASPQQTEAAIAAALPTLIAAFSRSAETDQGAETVARQMHAFGGGSLGDLLGGILGGTKQGSQFPRESPTSPIPPRKTSTESNESFDEILPPGFESNAHESPRPTSPPSRLPPPEPRASQTKESPLDRSLGPGNELPPSKNSFPRSPEPSTETSLNPESMDDVLGNVLGGKKKRVEESIGKSSGLDLRKIGPLLLILAPLVLGAMRSRASAKSTSGSKSINPKDLSDMMRGERASVEKKHGGNMIGSMLDQDGDGDFDLSDMIKIGMRFFFNKH